eukprot:Seg1565.3 transcript_id=Seg1565.3/GoldUCD/mRNA.D3Y31 product="Adhesion G protein-coupled receptor L2" protein_id=Seg1565.3/GoldUCD/D3Y31
MADSRLILLFYTCLVLALNPLLAKRDSVYKDASHYWPLDYIVQYKDAVSLSEATSYGPKGVFKGDGHGFMEIKLGTSALRLGEYTDSCLMKLQNCRSGLSFTFWFNVQDAEQSVNTVTLFNIKSSESDILKISFLKGQKASMIFTINDGSTSHKAKFTFSVNSWFHVSVIFSAPGNLQIMVNGQRILVRTNRISSTGTAKKVTFMIGSWLQLGNYQGPKVLLGEVAIFYKKLSDPQIKNIVMKNFYEKITLEKECQSNKTSLGVSWKTPFDDYEQIISYAIVVRSDTTLKYFTARRKATKATLTELAPDTKYDINVIAKTHTTYSVSSNVIRCATNATKKSTNKGDLKVAALFHNKIRVTWTASPSSNVKPVAYGISLTGDPAFYRLFHSKKPLNYTIGNLKPKTEYLIKVTIFSSSGLKVEEKKFKTPRKIEIPTNPVRSLSVASISWNSASLYWMPPVNYNDPALYYQINCMACKTAKVVETTKNTIRLDDFEENKKYDIQVKVGAKGVGLYEVAANLSFKTLVRFPAPTALNATSITWDTAILKWHPVKRTEDIVYRIAYHSESNAQQILHMNTSATHLKLKDLRQLMGYFVTVQSGNGELFGEESTKKMFFITLDHNECIDGSHSCTKFEHCINTEGSYSCPCRQGYIKDGKTCKPMKKDEPKCPKDFARNIHWSVTQNGQIAHSNCPKGTKGIARRICKKMSDKETKWMDPDLSDCVSLWMDSFAHKMRGNSENKSSLMKTLTTEYQKQTNIVGGDIQNVVSLMNDIVGMTKNTDNEKIDSSEEDLKSIAKDLLSLTDNLLSTKSSSTWNDLPKNKKAKSAGGILKTVENMARVFSQAQRNSTNKNIALSISTPNTVMEVRSASSPAALEFTSSSNSQAAENSIAVPFADNTADSEGQKSVYFGSFRSIESLLGTDMNSKSQSDSTVGLAAKDTRVSNVIAATLFPNKERKFDQPVVIVQKLPKHNNTANVNCVFWKFSSKGSGMWSAKGCKLHSSNNTHAICHCFHLTNFAVLMSVTHATRNITGHHEETMSLITQICICISLMALAMSFITFCSVRTLQSARNTTHKHLAFALFFAQLLFLAGIDKTFNIIACRLIGMALHYLFLVVFSLMGMEGFVLYTMLVRVYTRNGGYQNNKLLIACWVMPMMLVGVTAGIDFSAYGNEKYCWLTARNGFTWSFVGPVLLVVASNMVIMIMAIRIMKEKSKKRNLLAEELWYWIKCCSMLVSILGLSWILGIFYFNHHTIALAYAFNVLNALQGLSIFIFLCLLDQRAQEAYRKALCCIEKGQFTISQSRTMTRTMTGTKSASRQSREMNGSFRGNPVETKVYRQSLISMEDQEIVIEFTEDEGVGSIAV